MDVADKKTKVLVLDDDSDICLFSKELLSRRGYEVVTATRGEEAIGLMKSEHPTVALLDVHVPGQVTGMDVLRYAHDNAPECRCLMVTKEDRHRVAEEAAQLGASEYLMKPVTVQDLEAAILRASAKVRGDICHHG